MMVALPVRIAGLALLILAGSLPVAAKEPILRLSKDDCARLVQHRPTPDVAYQAGVDARGREVVPADLEGSPRITVPDHFLIPIEVDLADRLGIPSDPARFEDDALIGAVEVRGEQLYFNGQPLQDDAEAELATRCRGFLLMADFPQSLREPFVRMSEVYEKRMPIGAPLPLNLELARIEVDDTLVYRFGAGAPSEIDVEQVRTALSRYLVVGGEEWAHGYGHVGGMDRAGWIFLEDGTRLRWMLRPGGLGSLMYPDGGMVYLAGCRSPFESLRSDGAAPTC